MVLINLAKIRKKSQYYLSVQCKMNFNLHWVQSLVPSVWLLPNIKRLIVSLKDVEKFELRMQLLNIYNIMLLTLCLSTLTKVHVPW